MDEGKGRRAIFVYMVIVALIGFGLGLSDHLFANYFRDAHHVDAFQRGLLEIPREMPGIITMFILSTLAFWGDKRLSLLAHALNAIGILALALLHPSFHVMIFFLFINSLGMHMFFPLYDSLGMSLASKGNYGKALGKFNAIRMGSSMLAGVLVFFGFRQGIFSFTTRIIVNFLIAGILFAAAFVLTIYLMRLTPDSHPKKSHFVFRKAYIKFYMLAALFGGRKQIMLVFGPWILIELLDFGAEYIALLMITGFALSIFILPLIGRWIDKYGAAQIMIIEVALFFVIYLGYGVVSAGIYEGFMRGLPFVVAVTILINVLDRIIWNFGMARSIYMRSIAILPEDVTPTLATGMALDHMFSILSAILCGWIWWAIGPQYVFLFSSILAVVQLLVALRVKKDQVIQYPAN